MRQRNAWSEEFTTFIRSTMKLGLIHVTQQLRIEIPVSDKVEKPGNTTHNLTCTLRRRGTGRPQKFIVNA